MNASLNAVSRSTDSSSAFVFFFPLRSFTYEISKIAACHSSSGSVSSLPTYAMPLGLVKLNK